MPEWHDSAVASRRTGPYLSSVRDLHPTCSVAEESGPARAANGASKGIGPQPQRTSAAGLDQSVGAGGGVAHLDSDVASYRDRDRAKASKSASADEAWERVGAELQERDRVQPVDRDMVDATTIPELHPVTGAVLQSANAVNALIHLYRGELGRMTAYRSRLDTTTNWAITSTGLAATFTLGASDRTHAVFLFVMGLLYFFLHLESRRFSAYEASRRRTRLLERAFFPEVFGRTTDERWLEKLLANLEHPIFPTVPLFTSMSWRLRRIYMWLYSGVLLAWVSKLDVSNWLHPDIVQRAAVGSLPGWFVCAAVALLYGWLIYLTLRPGRIHPLANPYTHEEVTVAAPGV
jgi:uncharacterized membrane protein